MDAGGAMYVAEDRLTLMTEGGTTPTSQQMRTLSGALGAGGLPAALFRAAVRAGDGRAAASAAIWLR